MLVGVKVISVCVIFCTGVVDTDIFFSISRDDVHGFATKKRRLSLLKGKRVEMMRQMGKLTGRDLRSKRGEGSREIVQIVIATTDEYRKQRIEKNNETRKFESSFDCPFRAHDASYLLCSMALRNIQGNWRSVNSFIFLISLYMRILVHTVHLITLHLFPSLLLFEIVIDMGN